MHICHYLVFRCMDFRLKPSVLSSLLKDIGVEEGDYDLVSCAGSAKDMLGSEAERDFLLKQITLSQKLHQIKNIVVLYHDNCGAYGIVDPIEETTTQQADLAKIKAIIAEQFPELIFTAYIVKGVSKGELSLEKIF
ncbi:MAG: hypothetical protein AUJ36_02860 [Parcubacteria group bacterium CG1_02_41_26]|nr:MAG: hypothetical protein AUJ36_02860 [Parcubacteria group bacterium CG1_02_41_26]